MTVMAVILYGLIACYEWRYLRSKRRKQRTILIVLGYTAFCLLCLEVLYFIREQWTITDGIQAVFSPVQQWIKIGP
ncbi:hypothetical protein ACFQ88_34815 [Paenibacillus sp. NPDC056579]|uniref:hypothetical protein n=1 Tax=Paenibacillus sp. NPDC056579 TaxID=3345871 RepID=UPI0036BE2D2F